MVKLFRLLICACMIISLSACAPESLIQATGTPLPLKTLTSVPTKTPVQPTSTITATPEPTLTPTPVPTNTRTPPPSLPRAQALEKLEDIIRTNMGCDFPCWAGLTPGESKSQDVFRLLLSMSILADYIEISETGGWIVYSFPLDNLKIKVFVEFSTNPSNGKLQTIRLSGYSFYKVTDIQVYDAQAFHDLFEKYSLKNILKQYGKPFKVTYGAFVLPEGSNFNPSPSNLTIFYPDEGVFIRYTGPADRTGDIVRTCLNNVDIDVRLLSPADKNRYEEILSSSETGWSDLVLDFELQDVTGMSIDEFYERFSSGNEQCIQTSATIWPGP